MKKLYMLALLAGLLVVQAFAQNDYYFPQNKSGFDPNIPTPEEFLGYPIGSHYTRHDRIVAYFAELARLSDKATFEVIGKTYEERPQVILTITSPQNHARLEQIRQEHLTLIDPAKPEPNAADLPVVVNLGYSVHGAETSSGEAALLTAYYLIASQNPETQAWLNEAVITMDPALNPDGRDRMATWHNQYKSFPPVADPYDAEHNAAWPGGRTNHFWFDLNRDWLSAVHVESQARLEFFHRWYPNVMIDFHEMGTNSAYYFEPSPPLGSESPVVPRENYEVLNTTFAEYFAEALDELGALYFTKEVFDNFSPIYGSTYPDFQGGLGVTFEVGSSRGLVQESQDGLKTFGETILRHVATGIATVRGAVAEKELLFGAQKRFFKSALTDADKNPNKAFIFGSAVDENLTQRLLELMLRHRIEIYEVPAKVTADGKTFEPGKSYIVPTRQPQYRMVHSFFEEMTSFVDSTYYDVTGYSIAHGYGVPFAAIKNAKFARGERVQKTKTIAGGVENGKSDYAYVFSWQDFNASRLLYKLQTAGIMTRVAFKPFSIKQGNGKKDFGYGSIVIPVKYQQISADSLYKFVNAAAADARIKVTGAETGLSVSGIDLGSNNIRTVEKPEVAIIIGDGIRANGAGAIWFLLNMHVGLPVSKIDINSLNRIPLDRYKTLILPDGSYNSLSKNTVARLKSWVQQGGTLVTIRNATEWAIQQELTPEKLLIQLKRDTTGNKRFDFVDASEVEGAKTVAGSIYRGDLDITNPLGFGFTDRDIYLLRDSRIFLKPSPNPYATVIQYDENPLVSGFVSDSNLKKISNTASLVVNDVGRGRAVLFVDDPYFRGYWYGTSRLLLNAIFFGEVLSVPSTSPSNE